MGREVEIVLIQENDLEAVARFLETQVAGQTGMQQRAAALHARLRWLLLDNPAYQGDTPVGWALRNESGQIVGTMVCAPQLFCFHERIYPFLMSSWFHVDFLYRGMGLFLFRRYWQCREQHGLFVTSANARAGALWRRFGGSPIPNTSHELVGIIRWHPILKEMLGRRLGSGRVTDVLSTATAPILQLTNPLYNNHGSELIPLSHPEDVASSRLTPPPDRLAGLRNREFIRWRYFTGPDSTKTVFALRVPRKDREYLVAVNQTCRGQLTPIQVLNVLDLSWDIPPDFMPILCTLLADYYRGKIDVLVYHCLTEDRENALMEFGFWQNQYEAPQGWWIPSNAFSTPNADWYLMPADGDALI